MSPRSNHLRYVFRESHSGRLDASSLYMAAAADLPDRHSRPSSISRPPVDSSSTTIRVAARGIAPDDVGAAVAVEVAREQRQQRAVFHTELSIYAFVGVIMLVGLGRGPPHRPGVIVAST